MAASATVTASQYLSQLSQLAGRLDARAIDALADSVFAAWSNQASVFIFGNGGSALTASHWACDLVKTAAVVGQRRLRAVSLADNMGLITALGNDISFDEVFAFQLESHARAGDLAVAISASGNSPNVLRACQWAREHGLLVAALTGFGGGKLRSLADIHVNVPSENYGLIEDLHMSVGHIVAQALRARVAAAAPAQTR